MAGFFSETSLYPNRIEQARQSRLASGKPLIDLTSSNPTTQGLTFPVGPLQKGANEYFNHRRYAPNAKGDLSARQAITKYYQSRTPAAAFDPASIILTASTSESYRLLFSLLCEPGDNVLVPNVGYPLLELIAADQRIGIRTYLIEQIGDDWEIASGSVKAAADERTRAIVIISPHNPTGMIVAAKLKELTDIGLPLIADEVFSPYNISAAAVPCVSELHPELPVFVLNGISKMLALPDLKLGWIALNTTAATYVERLEILNDIYLGGNSLTQALLPTLLAHSAEIAPTVQQRLQINLNNAKQIFERNRLVRVLSPSGGWSLMLQILTEIDEEAVILKLLEEGVFLHPGFFYGCERDYFLIASLITEPAQFRQGMDIVDEVLQHY